MFYHMMLCWCCCMIEEWIKQVLDCRSLWYCHFHFVVVFFVVAWFAKTIIFAILTTILDFPIMAPGIIAPAIAFHKSIAHTRNIIIFPSTCTILLVSTFPLLAK